MKIRDLEIQRLVKYAEALGVCVIFSDTRKAPASAEWTLDGEEICIYTKKQYSKTDTILSLIHEISHTLNHIHRNDRQEDEEFEEAIGANNEGEAQKKHYRKILKVEQQGTEYWYTVYKETNLQIPLWKLEVAKIYDIWQYEVLLETGKWPTVKEKAAKRKQLKAKYKDKKYA